MQRLALLTVLLLAPTALSAAPVLIEPTSDVVVETVELAHLDAADAAQRLLRRFGARLDLETGDDLLTVSGAPHDVQAAVRLLDALDAPPPTTLVRLVEVAGGPVTDLLLAQATSLDDVLEAADLGDVEVIATPSLASVPGRTVASRVTNCGQRSDGGFSGCRATYARVTPSLLPGLIEVELEVSEYPGVSKVPDPGVPPARRASLGGTFVLGPDDLGAIVLPDAPGGERVVFFAIDGDVPPVGTKRPPNLVLRPDDRTEAFVVPVSRLSGVEVREALRRHLGDAVELTFDDRTHTALLRGPTGHLMAAHRLLQRLDAPRTQVVVRAAITAEGKVARRLRRDADSLDQVLAEPRLKVLSAPSLTTVLDRTASIREGRCVAGAEPGVGCDGADATFVGLELRLTPELVGELLVFDLGLVLSDLGARWHDGATVVLRRGELAAVSALDAPGGPVVVFLSATTVRQ